MSESSTTETLIDANPRLRVAAAGLALIAATLAVAAATFPSLEAWTRGLLAASGTGLLGLSAAAGWMNRRPRVARCGEFLILRLMEAKPVRVPLAAVECFFYGQADSPLRASDSETQVANVVIRLADKAEEWHERPIHPALGRWCGGYITLSGLWCEPLSVDSLGRLNRRLAEARKGSTRGAYGS